MNLYERDFTKILTDEERDAQKDYAVFEQKCRNMQIVGSDDNPMFSHSNVECKIFLWRHNSLYPNNSLDFIDFKRLNLPQEAESYKSLLYGNGQECAIQNYIKCGRKWFLPGSILKDYNFGHHDAYLFPEMMLGKDYKVDYALLGKNSDGYSMVLVEFEKADTKFLLDSSNETSKSVRSGITQINDWKRWIDSSRTYFLESFGLRDRGVNIPITRFHYCLVVSRRDFMDERALEVRSQLNYEMQNTKIITFDRLSDNIRNLERNFWS
jgi:hypothetical protein